MSDVCDHAGTAYPHPAFCADGCTGCDAPTTVVCPGCGSGFGLFSCDSKDGGKTYWHSDCREKHEREEAPK